MKLTKSKLKQIIREELEATLVDEGLGDFFGKMKTKLTGKDKKIKKWIERAEKMLEKFKADAGWDPDNPKTPRAEDFWIPSALEVVWDHYSDGLDLIKSIGGKIFGGRAINPELFKYFKAVLQAKNDLIGHYKRYPETWFDDQLAKPGFERSEREREEREKEEKEKRENPYLRDFEAEGEQMGYDSGPSDKWKEKQAHQRWLKRRIAKGEHTPWRTHGGGSGRVQKILKLESKTYETNKNKT